MCVFSSRTVDKVIQKSKLIMFLRNFLTSHSQCRKTNDNRKRVDCKRDRKNVQKVFSRNNADSKRHLAQSFNSQCRQHVLRVRVNTNRSQFIPEIRVDCRELSGN